ncbi:calmodulin-binding protein [Actinidia rufa]|uniref:Calmodulin-binding protein n=1 Tax=Actinidia rufa TaxID=165716 RepID=A0A7J0G8W4_9ERIC|nr:calmodulin-binding protein [Actinidia rufa]
MHFVLCSPSPNSTAPVASSSVSGSFEFDFSARFGTIGSAMAGSMSSADELFLNGQIRPMKLSTHLKRPQMLAPLIDLDETEDLCGDEPDLCRRCELRRLIGTKSTKKIIRPREVQSSAGNEEIEVKENDAASEETTPSMSASSSRSSSVSRSSKRWVFLKEFLYRSKSEGRNNGHKFWTSISFSPVKDRKAPAPPFDRTDFFFERQSIKFRRPHYRQEGGKVEEAVVGDRRQKAGERGWEAEGSGVGARAALQGEQSAGGGDEEEDVLAVQAGIARMLGVQLEELWCHEWFLQEF